MGTDAWKRFTGQTSPVRVPESARDQVGDATQEADALSGASPRVYFGTSAEGARVEYEQPMKPTSLFAQDPAFFGTGGAAAHEDLTETGLRVHYAPDLPRPKFVKHYVLGPKLGEGAYAKVKEGMDSQTLRLVAMKIIDRRFLRRLPGGLQNMKREIAVMKALGKHENVIELVDVIDDPSMEKLYLALELVNGCSLQDLIDASDDNRIPEVQTKYYLRKLMDGLSYIHNRGIIHRDIKPANLMLTTGQQLKISDFGVAEFLDKYKAGDDVYKTSGSPAFQAPEMAKGEENYSGMKVDVWASGVTVYYCLTGKVPFNADNLVDLFRRISEGKVHIPDWLDPVAADLLRGMLTVDWRERLSVKQVLQHPWLKSSTKDDATNNPAFIPVPKCEPQILKLVSVIFGDTGDAPEQSRTETFSQRSERSIAEEDRLGKPVEGNCRIS